MDGSERFHIASLALAEDWYGKHGMKQARKERVAPSHLRFNHEDPVMPGSLRRPKEVAPALLAPAQVIEVRVGWAEGALKKVHHRP